MYPNISFRVFEVSRTHIAELFTTVLGHVPSFVRFPRMACPILTRTLRSMIKTVPLTGMEGRIYQRTNIIEAGPGKVKFVCVRN